MSNMAIILLTILLVTSLAVAGASAQSSSDGRQVVESVCNKCHTYGRICLNLGREAGWWHKTTKRMIQNGAPMGTAQADAAASFLATLKPGSEPVCK